MGVGKFREENIKVLMENWLLRMIGGKMIMTLVQELSMDPKKYLFFL
jgi:hypothetical protein